MEPFEVDEFPWNSEITQMFDCTLIVKIPVAFIHRISKTQDVLSVKIRGKKFGVTHLKGAAYTTEGFTTAMIVFEKPNSIPEVMKLHEALCPLANDAGAYTNWVLFEKIVLSTQNEHLIQDGMQICGNRTGNAAWSRVERGRPPPYGRAPSAAIRSRPQAQMRAPSRTSCPLQPLPAPVPLPMDPQRAPSFPPFGPNIRPPPRLTYNGPDAFAQKTDMITTRRTMPKLVPQPRAAPCDSHVWGQRTSATSGCPGPSDDVPFRRHNAIESQNNVMIQNLQIQQNIYEGQMMRQRKAPPPYELSHVSCVKSEGFACNQMVDMREGIQMNAMFNQPNANYAPANTVYNNCDYNNSGYNEMNYFAQQNFQMPPDCGQNYARPRGAILSETTQNEQFVATNMFGKISDQNAFPNGCSGHANLNGNDGDLNYWSVSPRHRSTKTVPEEVDGGGFTFDELPEFSHPQAYRTDHCEASRAKPNVAEPPLYNEQHADLPRQYNPASISAADVKRMQEVLLDLHFDEDFNGAFDDFKEGEDGDAVISSDWWNGFVLNNF